MMNKRNLLSMAIAMSLATAAYSQAALAQDNNQAQASENVFEEVIVTATKREESIYDVPVAISAFTADGIERQGITNLTDIGKFVPNMNVTEFSAGHTSSANPFIRGIGLQDHLITTDPGVGVYIDGVYLGRQVGQNWSLANIARVEVLRGPQGTLYGRNSIGGAVNIITVQPGDAEGGRISFQAGSRGRFNGDIYMNGNLSDTVAMSFTAAYKSRDGVGSFTRLPNARERVGEMDDVSGRIALKWKPTDRLSLTFTADGNDGEGGLRPYTTLIDELPNGAVYGAGYRNSDVGPNPYDNNTGQANQTQVTNSAHGYSLTAELDINDNLDAKFIASDRHSEYRSGLDDDSLFDDFLSFPEDGEADQTSFELQLNGVYGDLDFVAGLYYFEEEGMNVQNPYTFNGGPGDILLAQDMDSKAIFANVGYQVSDKLRISGGLRYTEDDKTAMTNIVSGLIVTQEQRDWSELSWEAAATFELNDSMSVYGTIQNGYQSGQFSLDFTQPGNVSRPNCFAANDNITAINYETGLKGVVMDNLQMSVSLFYTDYSDLPYQVSTTTGAGFDTRNIIVDQTSTGIEWESTWAVSEDFMLHTTLGYIDVDVDDPVAEAPLTPDWTASISPEYTLNLGNGGEVVMRADWSYRDDMYGEPTADAGRMTGIDSRDLLNFDVTYYPADANWTLSAYGRNVSDERYDNARLNTGDYVLIVLSNDPSEFGMRWTASF
jgi:iron complex outermembrane receptor protein